MRGKSGAGRGASKQYYKSPIFIEPLETRRMLSVAVSSMIGQLLTKGSYYDYDVTYQDSLGDAPVDSDATKTQEGPATSPTNGTPSYEIYSTFSDGAVANNTTYVGVDSNGLVQYETYSNLTGTFGTSSGIYSPGDVLLPPSLTATQPVNTTTSYAEKSTSTDGTVTLTNYQISDVFTLASQTTQAVTVPAGTFQAYQVTDVQTTTPSSDPAGATTETDIYDWAPTVGPVKEIRELSGGGTYTIELHSATLQDVLSFASQPTGASVGNSIPTFSVDLINPNGTVDTSNNSPITLALQGGDGTLSGTATVSPVNGVATFSNLSISAAGSYTLVASSANAFGNVTSNSFTVGSSGLAWTGGGDGISWSDPKNWNQDIAPQSGDSLTFPGGAPLNPNNDIAGLTLNSIDIQGSGYTLSGNAISLTGGLTSEAGNNTYNINTTLVGSPTLDDQTGDLTINADISGGNVTLDGTGTFTLDQSDTYTGNTTLDSGVTIDDDTVNAFGSGTLTIGAGSSPVEINGSSTPAMIANAITFQDGATLETDPEVDPTGPITIIGYATLTTKSATDVVNLSGNTIGGAGVLIISGNGTVNMGDDIAPAVVLNDNAAVNLKGKLEAGSGNQVVVIGATTALDGVSGNGGIDVNGGNLNSGPTAQTKYSGDITLETGGEITDYDPSDGAGFGTGTLDLKGGKVVNAANTLDTTGIAAKIDNAITLEGNVTVFVGGNGFSNEQNLYFDGGVNATSASTLNLDGGAALLISTVTGPGGITFAGTGAYGITNGISTDVVFANSGKDDIGGAISEGKGPNGELVTVDGSSTVLELLTGAYDYDGEGVNAVSGSGGIQVSQGTLVTEETHGAPGLSDYSGNITLDPNGTIKYYDDQDADGLGTGTLFLTGGTIQDDTNAGGEIGNNISLQGNVSITPLATAGSYFPDLDLEGSLTATAASTLTLTEGALFLNSLGGEPITISGSGGIVINNVAAQLVINATGFVSIAGKLSASDGPDGTLILIDGANTNAVLQNKTGEISGHLVNMLTGTGGIEVLAGTLQTGQNSSGVGIPGYTGSIILDEDGTIQYYDTLDGDGLGTGNLTINGGTLQNSSGAAAKIDNPITLQGDVTFSLPADSEQPLVLSGTVTAAAKSTVTLSGGTLIIGSVAGDEIDFAGNGDLGIAESIGASVVFANDGSDAVGGDVAASDPGPTILVDGASTHLLLTSSAGSEDTQTFQPLSGGGGIEVLAGTLVTDETTDAPGIPDYTGNVILDDAGTIKYYDTKDGDGLGTGTLDLKGGTLQNSTGASAVIDNPITVEGPVTLSTPATANSDLFAFYGKLTVTSVSMLTLGGEGGFAFRLLAGPGPLTIGGNGDVIFSDSLSVQTTLMNAGLDILGGSLGTGVTVAGADTVLELEATDQPALHGAGNIQVNAGTLVTDQAADAPGIPGYTGDITLGANGTIQDYDTRDSNGLGTGTLLLNGGTLENPLDSTVTLANPITVNSAPTVSSPDARIKFANTLTIATGGNLTVVGSLVLTGGLTGAGSITMNGDALEIAGSNPNFTGNVTVTSGTIQVVEDDALGSGPLVANLKAQGYLESVSSVDPVLENPLTVESGTLTLEGQFTFPQGVTVNSGATLEVSGNTSQVVVSGPLAGGGTIVVGNGTFSDPGGSSGFSGNLQFQGGLVTPTLTVVDTGGAANGSPFPATATLSAPGISSASSLQGVSPTFAYYAGSSATGTPSSTAPSSAGTYTVVASFAGSTDYSTVQSGPVTFTITPAVTDKLVFSVSPQDSRAGDIGTVVVQIENSQGQLVTSDNSTVTLSVASGSGVLGGTVTVKAKHGVATFSRLLLTTAGTYTLKATDGADAAATSQSFNIKAAAPAKLVFVQQPNSTTAGSSIGTIVVDVEDRYGNLETGFDSYVTLWLQSEFRFGRIQYLAVARAVNGVATFKGFSIVQAGMYRLIAGIDPFAVGASNSFTISPLAPQPKRKCGS